MTLTESQSGINVGFELLGWFQTYGVSLDLTVLISIYWIQYVCFSLMWTGYSNVHIIAQT